MENKELNKNKEKQNTESNDYVKHNKASEVKGLLNVGLFVLVFLIVTLGPMLLTYIGLKTGHVVVKGEEIYAYSIPIFLLFTYTPAFMFAFIMPKKRLRVKRGRGVDHVLWHTISFFSTFGIWFIGMLSSTLSFEGAIMTYIICAFVYMYALTRVYLVRYFGILTHHHYFFYVTNYFIFNTIFYFLLIKFFM